MLAILILMLWRTVSTLGSASWLILRDVSYLSQMGPDYLLVVGRLLPVTFGEFMAKVKATLGLDSLRLVTYDETDFERVIERGRVCGGSGQSFLSRVLLP